MSFKEIQELIKLIDKSDLAEFKLKNQEVEILIRNQKYYAGSGLATFASAPVMAPIHTPVAPQVQASNVVVPTTSENTPKTNLIEIKSPMVGTFYRSSGPGKGPFVSVGDAVEKGSVVCIIEAMKLFNEIESEFSGKIVKVLVEDATPVEYDQVLFLIEP